MVSSVKRDAEGGVQKLEVNLPDGMFRWGFGFMVLSIIILVGQFVFGFIFLVSLFMFVTGFVLQRASLIVGRIRARRLAKFPKIKFRTHFFRKRYRRLASDNPDSGTFFEDPPYLWPVYNKKAAFPTIWVTSNLIERMVSQRWHPALFVLLLPSWYGHKSLFSVESTNLVTLKKQIGEVCVLVGLPDRIPRSRRHAQVFLAAKSYFDAGFSEVEVKYFLSLPRGHVDVPDRQAVEVMIALRQGR